MDRAYCTIYFVMQQLAYAMIITRVNWWSIHLEFVSVNVRFHSDSSFFFVSLENTVTVVKGIKGLASGVFFDNLGPSFLEVSFGFFEWHFSNWNMCTIKMNCMWMLVPCNFDLLFQLSTIIIFNWMCWYCWQLIIWLFALQKFQFISYGKDPKDYERLTPNSYSQIYADITTTFTILIGIFFPSVTGKCRSMHNNCNWFKRVINSIQSGNGKFYNEIIEKKKQKQKNIHSFRYYGWIKSVRWFGRCTEEYSDWNNLCNFDHKLRVFIFRPSFCWHCRQSVTSW